MRIDIGRCELVAAPPGVGSPFEAVRERLATVTGVPRRGHEALRHAVVECRTHELVDGRACVRCRHFLNAVPTPGGREVLVRCVVFETDAVEALMTPAVNLVTIEMRETTAVAAARMLDHDVNQLVVTEDGQAVGLIEASTIPSHHGPVGRHLAQRWPVVPRTMSLAAAALAFRAESLDVVGVVDGKELVGMLTRGDLRRAGVPGL